MFNIKLIIEIFYTYTYVENTHTYFGTLTLINKSIYMYKNL